MRLQLECFALAPSSTSRLSPFTRSKTKATSTASKPVSAKFYLELENVSWLEFLLQQTSLTWSAKASHRSQPISASPSTSKSPESTASTPSTRATASYPSRATSPKHASKTESASSAHHPTLCTKWATKPRLEKPLLKPVRKKNSKIEPNCIN